MGEEVHRHSGDLVDDCVANTVTEVAQIVFARHVVMQAGELPVATSFVAVMQIATKLSVINVLIYFGDHFEQDEAGWVVAAPTAGAVVRGTKGSGEAEVQGGADEPAESAIDIALRGELNSPGDEFIVREPSAGGFGKRLGEGLSVVLIEDLGLGDQGIEIKGRELLIGKR